MKIRALSSFFHPQEDARAEDRDTKRWWIPMDPHRRATQTRLLRLAHAVKCRRQRSPCRRQQLRREALPPCALLHRVQALGSENLNRLNLVLVPQGGLESSLMAAHRGRGPRLVAAAAALLALVPLAAPFQLARPFAARTAAPAARAAKGRAS